MAVTVNIPTEVTQTITDGVTITAPSENAVFDALSLKANLSIESSMITVVCGNSIASAVSLFSNPYISNGLILSNMFSGSAMRFKEVTASTRTDKFGVYGYSGASLATIIPDLEAQWFAPLATANIIPDLVVGYALLENDIFQGRTISQMTISLNSWILNIKNRYPGAKILLCCPRPSFGYSTATMISNYQAMRAYTLSLDDNYSIFATDSNGYESSVTAGYPSYHDFTGSISGTTLTVSATSDTIYTGCEMFHPTTLISYGVVRYQISGTPGGVGDYFMSTSTSLSSTTIRHAPYTDNGPHPNAKGSAILARVFAATLNRISAVWKQPYYAQSVNLLMDGTAPATGVGTTGTKPTSLTLNNGNGTFVELAEQPGFLETITFSPVSGSNTSVDLGVNVTSANTISPGANKISVFIKVQIVSGASYFRSFRILPYVTDGTGSYFATGLGGVTNNPDIIWQDGDTLTFISPPISARTGTISSVTNYQYRDGILTGGTFSYRIISQGVYFIS